MAFPVDGATPQLSGITIPTVWSGKLLIKFYEASVVPAICNTEYEGEISDHGDQVEIRSTPDITINTYAKGEALTYEQPAPTKQSLLIDKGKYWAFIADDVDVKQADYGLPEDWGKDASEKMKISVDTEVLAAVDGDAHADNVGNTAGARSGTFVLGETLTPVVVTKTNVLDVIVDTGSVLDEQDVPESDRYLVLPAWMCGMIKKSDLKDASLAGDGTSIMRNGRVGMIDRYTLYMSNLLEMVVDGLTTATNCLFGHKSAITFASQYVKSESLPSPTTFGTLYRGLKVYGYKVIKPEALGVLYASQTAAA